jgi:hypothetical protein
MNIGWATSPLAQHIPVDITNAGSARGRPSVNTYKEVLRHQWVNRLTGKY